MKLYQGFLIASILFVSFVYAEDQAQEEIVPELDAVESQNVEAVEGSHREGRVVHPHHIPFVLKKKLLFFKFKKLIPLHLFLLKNNPNGEQLISVDENGHANVPEGDKVQFQAYIIPNDTPLDVQPVHAEEEEEAIEEHEASLVDDDDDEGVDADKPKDALPLLVYALQRPVSGEPGTASTRRKLPVRP